MKMLLILLLSGVLLVLSNSPALAGKADGPKAKLFAKYDTNKNGVIDGSEKEALRKDFEADKEGALKRFDTNKNGKLDDDEIAAIKPPAGKKKAPSEKTDKTEKGEKPEK
jgi:hypothetical protein